jgi:hypothetical protein
MTQLVYKIHYFPDQYFWDQLAKLPLPKGEYPAMLMMGNIVFSYAPWNVVEGYTDLSDPTRALHLVAPTTNAPIKRIGYFFGPQRGVHRKVYVAFFYGPNTAVLSECPPAILLHTPLGLRLPPPSTATYTAFTVADFVTKGDDAPIQMTIQDPNNPKHVLTIVEVPQVGAGPMEPTVLQFRLQMPGKAMVNINAAPAGEI